MNTDKQLFQLFAACPEWLFELAGLDSPGPSEMRSFTVKALERRTDGLVVPKNPRQPLTVAEFQFSRDDTIYRRVVSEMLAAQEAFNGRAVRGLIVFGSRRCDPKTKPWTQIVQSIIIDEAVETLRQQHPRHPLTAVLQPVVESRQDILESTAVESFRTINQSSVSQRRKEVLITVFMDWLTQRLPGKNREEIKAMLFDQLTPFEETQFYKDVVNIGREEGREEGRDEGLEVALLELLQLRFPEAPQTLKARIRKLPASQRQRCFKVLATADALDDVRQWVKQHAH